VTHPGKQVAAQGCPVPTASTWLTLFTDMFMHGGLLHLGGNMLFLWIFGNNVEDSMGRPKFLVFYLLAGLAATAGQILVGPNSRVPNLGASGAIAGVLAGYLVLFPGARILSLVFLGFFYQLLEVPAVILLGFWFVLQLVNGFGSFGGTAQGGVAFFAHIGGFALGVVVGLLLRVVGAGTARRGPGLSSMG
jgi:membrane associated rhomboid family serine protease